MPGRRVWWSTFLLVTAPASFLIAQGTAPVEQQFRDAIVQKQRFPRGFCGDDLVRWHWDGARLIQEKATAHTAGAFKAQSVEIKGNKVEIVGERKTLQRSSTGDFGLSGVGEKVRIEVDLGTGDVDALVGQQTNLLFYRDVREMLDDLPAKDKDRSPLG